jgi:hypothetical protein
VEAAASSMVTTAVSSSAAISCSTFLVRHSRIATTFGSSTEGPGYDVRESERGSNGHFIPLARKAASKLKS